MVLALAQIFFIGSSVHQAGPLIGDALGINAAAAVTLRHGDEHAVQRRQIRADLSCRPAQAVRIN